MVARRKSDERKRLEGTFQATRANPNPPKPSPNTPPKPAHLSTKAAAVWDDFSDTLLAMRCLTEADGKALEAASEAYADLREARNALALHDGALTYQTQDKNGNAMWRAYPEVAMVRSADQRYMNWLSRLGLTPTDREKLTATERDGDNNPFAETF